MSSINLKKEKIFTAEKNGCLGLMFGRQLVMIFRYRALH